MIAREYIAYVSSWAEVAFTRWRASGYRDIAAHDDWQRLRAETMRAMADVRKREGLT
ncbi:MAG TPA: hypothetical protein VHT52_12260 [Stellaceae bacterium]|jgi:hypothetical protein|nr:hypothetical protein [Stellaceae bacterium]